MPNPEGINQYTANGGGNNDHQPQHQEHGAREAEAKRQEAHGMREQVRESGGQFGHGLDRVCRCGKTKGEHSAERPFTMDEDGHLCKGFKPAKK